MRLRPARDGADLTACEAERLTTRDMLRTQTQMGTLALCRNRLRNMTPRETKLAPRFLPTQSREIRRSGCWQLRLSLLPIEPPSSTS